MEQKKLVRLLALIVFVAASASAFSLGALSYTLVTGDLPFGLTPMLIVEQKKRETAVATTAPEVAENRKNVRTEEVYVNDFMADLEKEREKLSSERQRIESEKKNAEQILKQAIAIQDKVAEKEKELNTLLRTIEETDQQNVMNLQRKISGMEIADGIKKLFSLEDVQAAKVLYSMDKQIAFQIVAECMKNPRDKEKITKINNIMNALSEPKKGKNKK